MYNFALKNTSCFPRSWHLPFQIILAASPAEVSIRTCACRNHDLRSEDNASRSDGIGPVATKRSLPHSQQRWCLLFFHHSL
ncbi:unnamed protein product [Scytosiphon promiscuus]